MDLNERIARVNEARKAALHDAEFQAAADEHQNAIESECKNPCLPKRKRTQKTPLRKYSEIYGDTEIKNDCSNIY